MSDTPATPRTCTQGHSVPDELEVCDVCGEPVGPTPPSPGRSLWDVMGHASNDSGASGEVQAEAPMEIDRAEPPAGTDVTGGQQAGSDDGMSASPRGLWDMMQQTPDVPTEVPADEPINLEAAAELAERHDENSDENSDRDDEWAGDGTADLDESWQQPETAASPDNRPMSRSCRVSLIAGVASLLLAGLGLVPPIIWTSLPALLVGLLAVYTGLVGSSESSGTASRFRGRQVGLAGAALGVVGIFLPRLLQVLL